MRFPALPIFDHHALLDPAGLKKAAVEPDVDRVQGLPS